MNEVLKLNPENEIEEIEEYLYIMNKKNNKVYIFNEFEKDLISLFNGKKSIGEISAQLENKFEQYHKDEFLYFVQELIYKELLISIWI